MIAKKLRGRLSWRPLLIYVYFEDEPGRRFGGQAARAATVATPLWLRLRSVN
jgi:hypothetical protein